MASGIDCSWHRCRKGFALFVRITEHPTEGHIVDAWLGSEPGAETMLGLVFRSAQPQQSAWHCSRGLQFDDKTRAVRIRQDIADTIKSKIDPANMTALSDWLREASIDELVETTKEINRDTDRP